MFSLILVAALMFGTIAILIGAGFYIASRDAYEDRPDRDNE